MELTILIAQTVSLAFLAAWLSVGVAENLIHPELNATYTAEVLDMTRLRRDFPAAYREVSYRRVANPGVQRALFRVIVGWELIATAALWLGTGALALAVAGQFDAGWARAAGLIGAVAFTSVWAGFLVAGNWFCYWFGHVEGQNTHFQMTLWGMANVVLLALA